MSATAQLTLEEFLSLPDTPGKQELLRGELISLPPAKRSHMEMAKRFQSLLETVLHRSRVWLETGYQIGDGWLQPDVSVIWPDQPTENDWFQGAPMLAIEIVSPGTTAEHIEEKTSAYLQAGAAEVWVVYPKTRSMTVSRTDSTVRCMGAYWCDLISITVAADYLAPPAA